MTKTTFSIRLRRTDYEVLKSLAALRKLSIAELAQQFTLDGLRECLNPVEIEQALEQEKQRLLQAAAEIRAGRGTDG